MREMIRLGGRLLLIALIAGLALGATYVITKEPIAEQTRLAAEQARTKVLSGNFTQDTTTALPQGVLGLYVDAETGGRVLEVEASGYAGAFVVTVGVDGNGVVRGVVVGSNNETPGLGKNAGKESFTGQFAGKDGAITVKKGGGATGNEVDALTGATITSQAVTDAVNRARDFALSIEVKP